MTTRISMTELQNVLKGLIEPTVNVKGKWLTFKATQTWAECGEAFKAIKEQHGIKSLFYRGGTIGVRAENVDLGKPTKARREPVYTTSASVLASLIS
jgi:hypothetical protein